MKKGRAKRGAFDTREVTLPKFTWFQTEARAIVYDLETDEIIERALRGYFKMTGKVSSIQLRNKRQKNESSIGAFASHLSSAPLEPSRLERREQKCQKGAGAFHNLA